MKDYIKLIEDKITTVLDNTELTSSDFMFSTRIMPAVIIRLRSGQAKVDNVPLTTIVAFEKYYNKNYGTNTVYSKKIRSILEEIRDDQPKYTSYAFREWLGTGNTTMHRLRHNDDAIDKVRWGTVKNLLRFYLYINKNS